MQQQARYKQTKGMWIGLVTTKEFAEVKRSKKGKFRK